MLLRKSKFFCVAYSDMISEKEFYAKEFSFSTQDKNLVFSMKLINGLDSKTIIQHFNELQFLEIEDNYLIKKITDTVSLLPEIKHIYLEVNQAKKKIKRLQFKVGKVVLRF